VLSLPHRFRYRLAYDHARSLAVFGLLRAVAKLAALIPRPHKNLVLYHGVLAARSQWRSRVVSYQRERSDAPASASNTQRHQRRLWAELMRRAFGYHLLACPRCGGKMVLLGCILQREVIAKILAARAGPSLSRS
jgi:predicted kinase